MSMFCPHCHQLMRLRNDGDAPEQYCPRCENGKKSQANAAPTVTARTSASAPAVPASSGRAALSSSPSMKSDRHRRVHRARRAIGGAEGGRSLKSETRFARKRAKAREERSAVHCELDDQGLFPFETIRKGQDRFLEDARAALREGKHLVAHAPTGIGKTAAALTAALERARKTDEKVFFLTSKQSQHKVAVETLRLIREQCEDRFNFGAIDVISKQNMCPRPESRGYYLAFSEFCSYEQRNHRCQWFKRHHPVEETLDKKLLHVEELTALCIRNGICPHRAALDAAEDASVIICDYNYIFSELGQRILARFEVDFHEIIVIIDEAHNLPGRICGNLDMELTPHRIHEASIELRNHDRQLEYYLTRLRELIENSIAALPAGEDRPISRDILLAKLQGILAEAIDEPLEVEEFFKKLTKHAEKMVQDGVDKCALLQCTEFFNAWYRQRYGALRMVSNWGKGDSNFRRSSQYSSGDDDRRVTTRGSIALKLLDPSVISRRIFDRIAGSIAMSGTLHPTSMFSSLVGLDLDRTVQRRYQSPFPPENRPVLITPKLTTRYRLRGPKMYERMAEKIADVAGAVPGNLAVFFTSYKLLSSVLSYLEHIRLSKALLVEQRNMNKSEKEELFTRLERLKYLRGGILLGVLGGSMSEGVDYAENLLSSIIVVGLPLAPPTLEVKTLRGYYSKKFGKKRGEEYGYLFPAMNKVRQAIGRCIRSETDRAVVVLMDERFAQQRYKRCLPPEWFITVNKNPEQYCENFFQ